MQQRNLHSFIKWECKNSVFGNVRRSVSSSFTQRYIQLPTAISTNNILSHCLFNSCFFFGKLY